MSKAANPNAVVGQVLAEAAAEGLDRPEVHRRDGDVQQQRYRRCEDPAAGHETLPGHAAAGRPLSPVESPLSRFLP